MKHKKLITILLGIIITAGLLSFIPELSPKTGAYLTPVKLTLEDEEQHQYTINLKFFEESQKNVCMERIRMLGAYLSTVNTINIYSSDNNELGRTWGSGVMSLYGCSWDALIHETTHIIEFEEGLTVSQVMQHGDTFNNYYKELYLEIENQVGQEIFT